MTGTSGHTIFVPLRGRAKIELYPSTGDNACEDCTKEFLVLDRNAFDGSASFCLPVPEVDPEGCPAGQSQVSYSVYARALGTPGGKSFTTTCAYDDGELWCSSITMKLERLTGKSEFMDVSKYLLFIYIDGDRYSLFDPALEGYFWRYDNDGLKLAQLRFYLTPTDVPAPGTVPGIASTAPTDPLVLPQCFDGDVTLYGNANTDFDSVTLANVTLFTPQGNGIDIVSATPINGDNNLRLHIHVASDAKLSPANPEKANTIYVDLQDGSGYTISVDFTVAGNICS